MKRLSGIVAVFAVMAMASFAFAAKADKADKAAKGPRAPKADVLVGKVISVDAAAIKVQKKVKKGEVGEELTVATDPNTQVTVNGQDGKLSDIEVGMIVRISPATGKATKIAATSPKAKGAGKAGKKKAQ